MSASTPSTAATNKRKMVQIGTHNGTFHCDEALGCYLLQRTDRFKKGHVVRSRDPQVLQDLDIVIDVGGIYDPGTPCASFLPSMKPSAALGSSSTWSPLLSQQVLCSI